MEISDYGGQGRAGCCGPCHWPKQSYERLLWPKYSIITVIDFILQPEEINHNVTELSVINIAVTVFANTFHLHVHVSWFMPQF